MTVQQVTYLEEGREWYVYRIPYLTVGSKDRFLSAGMQVYLPTYTQVTFQRGKILTVEKPKILDYIFVLATAEQVSRMIGLDNVRPVFRHHAPGEDCTERWLTVPSLQMHRFMLLVQGYEKSVEFCKPDCALLEKGDVVRITDGQFRGVEGVLMTSQGRSGGEVYVELSEGLGVKTVRIPDSAIQVLSVSRDSNRFCRNLQAFEKVLEQALQTRRTDGFITEMQREKLEAFLFRYSELRDLTYVNQAKMAACRYAANMLLQHADKARECLTRYETEINGSKNGRRASRRSATAADYINGWLARMA